MQKSKVSEDLSRKFANMGFLFAMVVVFIHVPHHMTPSVTFMENVFPGFLKGSANAWFFLAAGFFFAGHVGEPGWWRKGIIKRLHSLLVPYLVLNLLMMLLLIGYQRANFCFPVEAKGDPIWQSVLRAMGFWPCSPVDGPTWFIRSLLFFVLTTPIVFPLLKRLRIALPVLLVLFCLNVFGWDECCKHLGLADFGSSICALYRPDNLFYFLSGVTLRFHGIPNISKKLAGALLIIGAAFSMYAPMDALPRHNPFLYGLAYNLAKPFIIMGVFFLMPSRPWPKLLTGNAFAIYILHWQLITAAYIVCEKTGAFATIFGNPIWLTAYWFGVVAITIGVAFCVRKSQLLEKLILGGR